VGEKEGGGFRNGGEEGKARKQAAFTARYLLVPSICRIEEKRGRGGGRELYLGEGKM